MRTLAVAGLVALAFAGPAQAGQWVIEETDDNYIVEYTSDTADKKVDKPAENPAAKAAAPPLQPASPPAAQPSPGQQPEARPAPQRPVRIREQSRRERIPRAQQPGGTPDDSQQE